MKFKYYKELFREKFSRNNLSRFVKNQGFYIVLFACVAAVGVTALVMANNQGKSEIIESEPLVTDEMAVENNLSETIEDVNAEYEYFITQADAQAESPADEPAVTQKPSNRSSAQLNLKKPHDGTVVSGFSGEVVVFNESLNQWSSHNALDFEAKIGDDVKAAKAGEVVEVYEDALLGGVVVLKHGGDMVSVYKNIVPDADLTAKDKVDTGEVIGAIGQPGLKEDHLGPHLHFEFYINDKAVDAAKYFD